MPEPPYSAGQATPMRPSSPSLPKTSRGNSCFSSHSRECGRELRLRELADGLLEELLLLAQAEVQGLRLPTIARLTAAMIDTPSSASLTCRPVMRRCLLACASSWPSAVVLGYARLRARSGLPVPRRGPRPRHEEPRARPRSCGSARRRRARRDARPRVDADVGPPRARLAPPDPGGDGLRGPEVLRPRGRRLGGDPGVGGGEREEAPVARGGSTITQQLAKNLFFDTRKSAHPQAARARGRALAGAGPHQAADPRPCT